MPRTFGDGIIHRSHFDYVVDVDTPLPVHGGIKIIYFIILQRNFKALI